MTYEEEEARVQRPIDYECNKPFAVLTVQAGDDPLDTLQRIRSVLSVVVDGNRRALHSDADWRAVLPKWFVGQFAPESTQAEAEQELKRWRAMSESERRAHENTARWTLSNWVYWIAPSNRSWRVGGIEAGEREVRVQAITDEWPTPVEALGWVMRASGGTAVTIDWQ